MTAMNTNLIDWLIRMNSEGVCHLFEGKLEESIDSLHTGLNTGKNALQNVQLRSAMQWKRNYDDGNLFQISMDDVLIDQETDKEKRLKHGIQPYRFIFGIEDLNVPETSLELVIKCLAVLAFNLAMIHHEYGMHAGNLVAVDKSRGFYELSLSLIRSVRKGGLTGNNNGLLPLELALLNNLGDVYMFFSDTNSMSLCQNYLEDALLTMEPGTVDQETFAFFRSNLALFYTRAGERVAPAA